jgi:cytidine deaminase
MIEEMVLDSAVGLAVGLPIHADESAEDLRKLLPKFRQNSRELLRKVMGHREFSGQISASQAAELARYENVSSEKLMLELIPLAQAYSRAPISNFHVGVVVRGASGTMYLGANIEIPGQCLSFAVHAEQSALSNAYMHSEQGVSALAVGAAPCGHCRQFINEMSPDGQILILTPDKPPIRLSSILPSAFGPAALGMKTGAFPVGESPLALGGSASALAMAALDAARRSYAPYSESPSGVALQSMTGRVYRGSYIENVAFNPSLPPLQTALAAMIVAGDDYQKISGATLVEVSGAKISQKAVTETVLGAIAPNIRLQVVPARLGT